LAKQSDSHQKNIDNGLLLEDKQLIGGIGKQNKKVITMGLW
jgi:hypothetical protein